MIAFTLFGRPIYRYGLFYLFTFVTGYAILYRLAKTPLLSYLHQKHSKLFSLFRENLDDIFIILMLGVILGGRLGHVIFYDLGYYLSNIIEIVQINKGGMSFVGGILGVMIGLYYIKQKYSLTRRDFLLFGDCILLVVPLGSLLGRIGNFLNQELIGKEVSQLPVSMQNLLQKLDLVHIYTLWDNIPRVNINIIQSICEGGVLLLLVWGIYIYFYVGRKVNAGLISGIYMIGYGVIRFFMEYFKDLPLQEIYGVFSVSQLLSIGLLCFGVYVLYIRQNND